MPTTSTIRPLAHSRVLVIPLIALLAAAGITGCYAWKPVYSGQPEPQANRAVAYRNARYETRVAWTTCTAVGITAAVIGGLSAGEIYQFGGTWFSGSRPTERDRTLVTVIFGVAFGAVSFGLSALMCTVAKAVANRDPRRLSSAEAAQWLEEVNHGVVYMRAADSTDTMRTVLGFHSQAPNLFRILCANDARLVNHSFPRGSYFDTTVMAGVHAIARDSLPAIAGALSNAPDLRPIIAREYLLRSESTEQALRTLGVFPGTPAVDSVAAAHVSTLLDAEDFSDAFPRSSLRDALAARLAPGIGARDTARFRRLFPAYAGPIGSGR